MANEFKACSTRARNGAPLAFINDVVLTFAGDGCLVWPFSRSKGYAQAKIDGKLRWVHRYVCSKVNGEPPTLKHEASHNCGNGRGGCVNPKHLEWKTHAKNMADKFAHGTHHKGERHGQAKLNDMAVREIRALKGKVTHRELADRYQVSISAIGRAQTGAGWAHV